MSVRTMSSKLDLLEIINQQENIISKQKEAIEKLVNETVEQENMIAVLMGDELG